MKPPIIFDPNEEFNFLISNGVEIFVAKEIIMNIINSCADMAYNLQKNTLLEAWTERKQQTNQD